MKLLGVFEDRYWAKTQTKEIRYTARVFLHSKDDRFAFLSIKGEDGFGFRDHIETCGGGVEEGETFLEAAKREINEETGLDAYHFRLIGVVIDEYNLIERMTCSVYYAAETTKESGPTDRTAEEKILISEIVWLTAEETLSRLSAVTSPIGMLIHQRDLSAFTELLTFI